MTRLLKGVVKGQLGGRLLVPSGPVRCERGFYGQRRSTTFELDFLNRFRAQLRATYGPLAGPLGPLGPGLVSQAPGGASSGSGFLLLGSVLAQGHKFLDLILFTCVGF